MKYILILITSAFLVGCEEPNDPQPLTNTASWFRNPETVGTLPDGRVVKYIIRDMGSQSDHYIYFVDESTTTNYSVPQGKTTRQEVIVEIDGVKYVPLEKVEK